MVLVRVYTQFYMEGTFFYSTRQTMASSTEHSSSTTATCKIVHGWALDHIRSQRVSIPMSATAITFRHFERYYAVRAVAIPNSLASIKFGSKQ